jgi:hypothetical protein
MRLTKGNGFVLGAVLVAGVFVGSLAAEPLCLVKGGKAVATIVHPKWERPQAPEKELDDKGQPTPQYAAKEAEYRRLNGIYFANVAGPTSTLQAYMRRISGAALPIVEEGSEQHRAAKGQEIHVGRTQFVDGLGLDLDRKDQEHVVIKRVGDKLVIACGGDPKLNPRGLGFAVSTFLLHVLGVHHYLPETESQIDKDPLWTIVPKSDSVEVGDLDLAQTPDYLSRDFSLGGWANERTPWGQCNRISWGGRYHIPHNMGHILDPAKYGKSNPEFYPLLDGKRTVPPKWMLTKDWQPCWSNPAVVETVVKEARSFFDSHPESELLSLAQNDNFGWCQCEGCLKANGGRKYDKSGGVSYSNVYFRFLNQVCGELEKTHPGKLIGAMIYQNGTYEPPDFQIHPSIVTLLTRDFSVFHGSEREAKNIRDFIGAWSKVSKRLAVHAWHVDFQGADYPRLELKSTKGFLTFLHESGGISYHGEEYVSFGLDGPKTWITAQLLWDVDQDLGTLLQQFCGDCFGKAAAPMRRYFETMEEAWNKNTSDLVSDWCVSVPIDKVVNPVVLDECSRALDEALSLAATDKERRRIEHFRKAFEFTRRAYSVERGKSDCGRMALERDLTPGMFLELTARLNEAAFAREALAQYMKERMIGDLIMFLDGGAKREVKPIEPLYSQIASTLTVRLAREVLKGAQPSPAAFTTGLQERYAALNKDALAKIGEQPSYQGLAWERFNKQLNNFLAASVVVPKRQAAAVLDGTLSAGEWDAASVLTGFYAYGAQGSLDTKAKFQTEVRLGYDEKALYVAYRLIEQDVNHLASTYDQRDGKVWRDDSADFTILPPEMPKDKGRQYVVNPQGAVFDRIVDGDAAWNSKLSLKPGVDQKSNAWVVEMAIPWEDFGKKPESGQVWRAQFGRSDWTAGKCNASSWAPVYGNLCNTDYMGILLFE